MNLKTKLFFTSLCFIFLSLPAWAVDDNPSGLLTISGYLKDAANGKALIGATISVKELGTGTNDGKLNGWISYTLSKVTRTIAEINSGNPYPASYDKPHNINVVLNYEFTNQITLSGNWVYATGAPFTSPVGSYMIDNTYGKYYSARNGYRMRDYHRLDLSLSIKGKEHPGRKWKVNGFSQCIMPMRAITTG
jgi:hypothetical protein